MHDAVESRNVATVRASFDAWRDGTGGPWEIIADDVTWEITGNSVAAGVYTSKADFIGNVMVPLNARLSKPLRPTMRHMYADGDTVIVLFDAEATASDGLPYRNSYSWYLTLRDDAVVEVTAFYDSIAFDDLWTRVPV